MQTQKMILLRLMKPYFYLATLVQNTIAWMFNLIYLSVNQ